MLLTYYITLYPVHTNGIISVTQKLKLNRINSSINYILINDTHQSQIKYKKKQLS